jgi:hypothetical protein
MKTKQGKVFLRATAFWAILVLCTSLFSGCDYLPTGRVTIKDIISNPSQYDGKEVKVKGVVSDVTKIPLVGVKFYVLNDQNAQIFVVPKESVPASKSTVTVIGVVKNVAIIGGESIGPHIEEVRRVEF